jgi:hypothetical protein
MIRGDEMTDDKPSGKFKGGRLKAKLSAGPDFFETESLDDLSADGHPGDLLAADDRARRRYAVDQAVAHNRIEGIETQPAALAIFSKWIAGEISSDECTRLIALEAAEFMQGSRDAGRY